MSTAKPDSGHKSSIGIGDILNGIFQIKRFVASGGMGEVFEGVNINTDEIVAGWKPMMGDGKSGWGTYSSRYGGLLPPGQAAAPTPSP